MAPAHWRVAPVREFHPKVLWLGIKPFCACRAQIKIKSCVLDRDKGQLYLTDLMGEQWEALIFQNVICWPRLREVWLSRRTSSLFSAPELEHTQIKKKDITWVVFEKIGCCLLELTRNPAQRQPGNPPSQLSVAHPRQSIGLALYYLFKTAGWSRIMLTFRLYCQALRPHLGQRGLLFSILLTKMIKWFHKDIIVHIFTFSKLSCRIRFVLFLRFRLSFHKLKKLNQPVPAGAQGKTKRRRCNYPDLDQKDGWVGLQTPVLGSTRANRGSWPHILA